MPFDHPLFEGLSRAEVQSLQFTRGNTWRENFVELVLQKDGAWRTFRFDGVPWLRLGEGFPEVGWLHVRDVSDQQLDGLGIHVSDGEQSEAIEFWAADVQEIVSRDA